MPDFERLLPLQGHGDDYTARSDHAVGIRTIVNWSNDNPDYTGLIPKSAAFVSEVLRQNGYATASTGKWHLIPDPETTLAGPFHHWPTYQGFDYFPPWPQPVCHNQHQSVGSLNNQWMA